MNVQSLFPPQQSSIKSSYNVRVEYQPEGRVKASVLGWPECQVETNTKEEALQELQKIVGQRLGDSEIVSLEIEVPLPQSEHPWMKFAGMLKDDPDLEEFLAFIEEDRRQLDLEMEEHYYQIDPQKKSE
ncbi:hypothetical protein [Roseofilum sp. Guam]|uniref:hypothetical protein n=1 Tax=Roseofilum sp. Guam TaxID=2821502 RepID=UPI001B0492D6|nr:hypothetical protein [Roseofilum sp. Guam]MBP0030858.1 type II toxin-antitoxin system HicB family antitoxin [Roseofilum sp. Guam]